MHSEIAVSRYRAWKKSYRGYLHRMLSIMIFEMKQSFKSKLLIVGILIFIILTSILGMGASISMRDGPSLEILLLPYMAGNLIIIMISSFLGARIVSNDLENNSLTLYLSRPLRRVDYFLAKYFTPVTLLFFITVVPVITVYIAVFNATSVDPEMFRRRIEYLPPIFLFGILMIFTYTSISILFSTATKRWTHALLGSFVVILLTFFLAPLLHTISHNEYYLLISVFTSFLVIAGEAAGEYHYILIKWYHSAIILLSVNLSCILLSYIRIKNMDVEVMG